MEDVMEKSMKDLNEAVKDLDAPVRKIIRKWPRKPKESAERLLDYYGDPDEYSESKLIWYNTFDGWKRTVLNREEIPHNFPAQHTDFLEQYIDYQVPVEMYSALAEYDGSVVADRTKGELSARCAGTSMNFVAVNLAHEIVTGKRSVDEAREEYTRIYKAFQEGVKDPYTQEFQFDLPDEDTGDRDITTL